MTVNFASYWKFSFFGGSGGGYGEKPGKKQCSTMQCIQSFGLTSSERSFRLFIFQGTGDAGSWKGFTSWRCINCCISSWEALL